MNKNIATKIIAMAMGSFVFVGAIANTTTVFAQEAQNNTNLSIIAETQSEGVSRGQLIGLIDRLSDLKTEQHQEVSTMVLDQMQPTWESALILTTSPSNEWDYIAATTLYDKLTYQEERFHASIDFDNIFHDIMSIDATEHEFPHMVEISQSLALNQQRWYLDINTSFTPDQIAQSTSILREEYEFLMSI